MSTTRTIRQAKALNLNGAQPGTAAIVAKLIKAVEEERALRLRLQREANKARGVADRMEDRAVQLRDGALDLSNPAVSDLLEQEAIALALFAGDVREALARQEGDL